MTLLDWSILAAVLVIMVYGVRTSSRHMVSVADFLSANRSAGRYVLTLSQGLAGLGAITIVGNLEMNYVAGFSMSWWGLTTSVVVLVIAVSGWVVYRFRESRCLTLAEFFERRYSRNFRVFAGLIAWLSGIVNMGIFPAVGARFFITYCGLPLSVNVGGLAVSTFPLVMIVLLSIALYFVFAGGQIAVIITDFLQGVFVNVVFVVIVIYLVNKVDWDHMMQALEMAPEDASLINPFKTSHVEDFNFGYFLIGIFGVIYSAMSWQGTQGYNSSARSAHEAKMGSALTMWRGVPQNLLLLFVPIVTYTVMHHPDFAPTAGAVGEQLAQVDSPAVQSQLRSPLVLTHLLPVGLFGAFAAVMLAAFISTHDTYLHSWGSIFVQDVIMPFRKTPLTPKQHLRALRISIVGVAVFIFFFSLLFQQSQYIFLFFAITGAIFAGGSGAVIIGGLYWKRGTTPAAWAALITGSSISVGGIIIHQLTEDFPINGQMFWGLAMGVSSLVYVVVSLLTKEPDCDFDALLHRGRHRIADEHRDAEKVPSRGLRMLFIGPEFTKGDRIIYYGTYAWTLAWVVVFLVGTVYNLTQETVDDAHWAQFWKVYYHLQLAVAVFVIVWFTAGGIRDLRAMTKRLSTLKRDPHDDGRIREG